MQFYPFMPQPSLNAEDTLILNNIESACQRCLPTVEIQEEKKEVAVLVGGAPSINKHLNTIRKLKLNGAKIFAMNGTHDFLINNNIKPDYCVFLDARQENVNFVTTPMRGIKYLVASQVHPDVLDALDGFDVTLWHPECGGIEGMQKKVQDVIHKYYKKAHFINGGATVGLRTMFLAPVLGYRHLELFGYDSSNKGRKKHAYHQPQNVGQAVHTINYKDKVYEASVSMSNQAQQFLAHYDILTNIGIKINVTGEGLLPDMLKGYLERKNSMDVLEKERSKYLRMWEKPIYRKYSPCEEQIDDVIRELGINKGDSVIEFGVGCGRGAKKMQEYGVKFLGIDIASNCLDEGIHVPLCIATLWDLPEGIEADYGYCIDVMEHIPPEKVDDVLKTISERVSGCFFDIHTSPDGCGVLIGEKLHMTVQAPKWWRERMKAHFEDVRQLSEDEAKFVCKGRKQDV